MTPAADFRSYAPDSAVLFRKTDEPFGGLSNMAPQYPLEVLGVPIRTSEALYQAARFPHMPDVQRLIIEQTSPMTAKMRSKPYRPQSRGDWDHVRVRVMRWCLRVKLAQNWPRFHRLLLSTGDTSIVEVSGKDDFWGAKQQPDGMLVGANVLGRLLMELRQLLLGPQREDLRVVRPPHVSNFLLFGKVVGVVDAARIHRVDLLSGSDDGGELQPWRIGDVTTIVSAAGEQNAFLLGGDPIRPLEPESLPNGIAVKIAEFRGGQFTDVEVLDEGQWKGRRFRMLANAYLAK